VAVVVEHQTHLGTQELEDLAVVATVLKSLAFQVAELQTPGEVAVVLELETIETALQAVQVL